MAEISKTLVGGLIAVIFSLVIGTVYLSPYYTGTDICTSSRISGPWENITETIYFNETFPAIGRYYCAREAKITKEQCLLQDKLINSDGCKWGGKVGGTTELYVMVDPELSLSADSVKSYPLIDVGLEKEEGIKIDWIESETSMTKRCLGFEINKGLETKAVAGIILETQATNIKSSLVKKSIEVYNESIVDKCTTENIGKYPNGSDEYKTACTNKIITRENVVWTSVKIDSTEVTKDRFESIKLTDGIYKYCFETPITKTATGFGSSGEVKLALDSKLFVDRQNSGFWNTTWAYRKSINITNRDPYNSILTNYTMNITLNTSTLISGGKLNGNCSDLRIVCNDQSQNFILGNDTSLSDIMDYGITGCNQVNTTVIAQINAEVPSSSSNASICYFYYGNPNAEMYYKDWNYSIFMFADEFAGGKDTNKWTQDTGATFGGGKVCGAGTGEHSIIANISFLNTSYSGYRLFYEVTIAQVAGEEYGNVYLSSQTHAGGYATSNTKFQQYEDGGSVWNIIDRGTTLKSDSTAWAAPDDIIATYMNDTGDVTARRDGAEPAWNPDLTSNAESMWNFQKISLVMKPPNTCFDNLILVRWLNSTPLYEVGIEESQATAPIIGEINCTNGTSFKTSFLWNEPVSSCQVTCTDDTAVSYVKFEGLEGVSAFDTNDNNDTWFANLTNSSGVGNYFSVKIPSDIAKVNYSGSWNVSAFCSDGSLAATKGMVWTVANGNVNVSLIYPNTNLTKQNGTYITNVQVRKGCVGGECFNTSQYFTIGV